jgi:hypothetical protein
MRRIALLAIGATVLLAVNADAASHNHFSVNIGIGVPAPVYAPPAPVYAPPPAPVYAPPPAPVYAPPPPPPYAAYGYVWVPAYSVWSGYGYRTVPGAWVRPPYRGAVWVAPHWDTSHGHGNAYGHDRVWVNGGWRH